MPEGPDAIRESNGRTSEVNEAKAQKPSLPRAKIAPLPITASELTHIHTSDSPSKQLEELAGISDENLPPAYVGSEHVKMLKTQEAEGRTSAALFTDIDHTFFRRDRAETSRQLFNDLQEENYPVVAVTGNDFATLLKRIESGELPYFPIIAAAVGTEIYVLHQENGQNVYRKDEAYEQKLLAEGFDRPMLAQTGQRMLEEIQHPEWKLEFQHREEERAYREGTMKAETPFKMSFYAFAASKESLAALREEMTNRFPGQQVVIAEEINHNSKMEPGDNDKKYCIDILPVTKAGAVDYISSTTGVTMKVIAGDSGNDSEMLTGTGDVAIVVGGAKPELTAAIDGAVEQTEENRHFQRVQDGEGNLTKLYYRERGQGLGPESIVRAIRFLGLAQKFHNNAA